MYIFTDSEFDGFWRLGPVTTMVALTEVRTVKIVQFNFLSFGSII